MLPKLGHSFHENPEIFIVKSEMQARALRVEGKHSKARKIEVSGTVFPFSFVEMKEIKEAGLDATREIIFGLMNARSSLL